MNSSSLHDEKTFYQTFLRDLDSCQKEVIIESPFITSERMGTFDRIFQKLLRKNVKIYIFTRDPKEHDEFMEPQSEEAIRWCEIVGIQVLLCLGNHHRKLAIVDRKILWEGSLNILSQSYSREIMRRIYDEKITKDMFDFLRLGRFL
ncbi:MAG: phospholipase D-like domain-containing protein [Patescibacteria group bacterium]|nr:phospholipase D-like domain-containing protein [Patescibacteria group bacterium]